MSNKKIINNTLMLYARQILIIFVSLYSVRVVLNTLGVEEYGIYNVVAGIVTLCSFLSGSMASATQRFFSFALGKKDENLLKSTFCVNIIIYITIAIIAIIMLKTIGHWFVDNHLNIPQERKYSALVLYDLSVYGFVFSILSAPFMAIIIAHEDMKIYAYLSINEALMKLSVVFILSSVSWDKLELYGLLLLIVSIINVIIYLSICIFKYKECQIKKIYWNYSLFKEICSFTGWTLFGQFTTVARNQAVTILLNQFFNPSVVAARAISNTVASQVNMFSNNFNTGLYPPLIKTYAEKNYDKLFSLIFIGSKLTFFLMWVFALPLMIEMKFVLSLWLGELPSEVVLFTRLALIESLIFSISLPLTTAARAPGKMKTYELTLGFMQLVVYVLSYIGLFYGCEAFYVFVIAIIVNIVMFFFRLHIVSKLIGLSKNIFLLDVIKPILIIMVISLIPSLILYVYLPSDNLLSSVINIVVSFSVSCVAMYYIGLDLEMKIKIKNIIKNKLRLKC